MAELIDAFKIGFKCRIIDDAFNLSSHLNLGLLLAALDAQSMQFKKPDLSNGEFLYHTLAAGYSIEQFRRSGDVPFSFQAALDGPVK